MSNQSIRLQKAIADAGITSRRKAEEMILQGRVQVNGEKVRLLGTKVNPDHDAVVVDGDPIDMGRKENIYIVLNKPRGIITSMSDPEGRKTVMDLVQDVTERIYPVGRLDYLSEGLLLMTNDGELANNIIHPREGITKVYEVKVFGAVSRFGFRAGPVKYSRALPNIFGTAFTDCSANLPPANLLSSPTINSGEVCIGLA